MPTSADMEAMIQQMAVKSACADRNYPEGSTLRSMLATDVVVLDQHIATVCSYCARVPSRGGSLHRCPKCCFVKYCSTKCQIKDWKRCHKHECKMLKTVQEVSEFSSTELARLFVKMSLQLVVMDKHRDARSFMPEEMCHPFFHSPSKCRKLFNTWKPLREALLPYCGKNMLNFLYFMNVLAETVQTTLCLHADRGQSGSALSVMEPNSVIAYAIFPRPCAYAVPKCKRNVVYLTTIDPLNGPTLHAKAATPIKAGKVVFVANAHDLLASPIVLEVQRTFPTDCGYCISFFDIYMTERLEMRCTDCGGELDLSEHTVNSKEMVLAVGGICTSCRRAFKHDSIGHLALGRNAALTSKPSSAASSETELLVKADAIMNVIRSLRSTVAPTSFTLGILYRELANVYEELGRMDKCVEAYKMVISAVEKHLDKFDQNIFDGLSRLIVYHLERNEIAESLPFIETAWNRVQKIPGKDSFDFYVLNKLRKAVKTNPNFSFSDFCNVAP